MRLPTDRVFSEHLVECPATRRRNAPDAPDALDARNKGGRASSEGGVSLLAERGIDVIIAVVVMAYVYPDKEYGNSNRLR